MEKMYWCAMGGVLAEQVRGCGALLAEPRGAEKPNAAPLENLYGFVKEDPGEGEA
jgi:hypothetical protein